VHCRNSGLSGNAEAIGKGEKKGTGGGEGTGGAKGPARAEGPAGRRDRRGEGTGRRYWRHSTRTDQTAGYLFFSAALIRVVALAKAKKSTSSQCLRMGATSRLSP